MKNDETYIRKIKPKHLAELYDTIVLGDVHLGLEVCRVMALIEFLQIAKFKRLIFQGDTFDHQDLTSLSPAYLHFLEQVRTLEKSGVEVVWIHGNHDTSLLPLLNRFYRKDCIVEEKYIFEVSGMRYLVLHGHVFDEVLTRFPLISRFFSWAYEKIQKYDGENQSLAAFLKGQAKTITRLNEILKWEGFVYAKANQCDAVVCGHTHKLHHEKFKNHGNKVVHYLNAGCWTEKKCGAIGICLDGKGQVLRITTWRKPRRRA